MIGKADRRAPARSRGDRLQHRLDPGAAGTARALQGALRRHRAGDQAGLRAVEDASASPCSAREATVKREYTRALIREFAARLRGDAGRLAAARRPSPKPSSTGEPVATPTSPPRSRPASSRRTAAAPTPWCWPARTIRCCCPASKGCAPWPVDCSIRRRRSPAASPICCGAPASPRARPPPQIDLHLRPRALRRRWQTALAGFGF